MDQTLLFELDLLFTNLGGLLGGLLGRRLGSASELGRKISWRMYERKIRQFNHDLSHLAYDKYTFCQSSQIK